MTRGELAQDEAPCFQVHGENRSEKMKVSPSWLVCVLGVQGAVRMGMGGQLRAQEEPEVRESPLLLSVRAAASLVFPSFSYFGQ